MATPDINLNEEDIVNRALALIGGGSLISLDDDNDLSRQANLIYWMNVEWALGLMPWVFARRTYKLSRLAEAPLTGYQYAYGLPGARLGYPIKNYSQARRPDLPLRDFVLEADELHTDAEDVWSIVKVAVAPNVWPPEFRKAVITLIAADLAVPVAHDTALADAQRRLAVGPPEAGGSGGLMGMAIAKETALSPPEGAYTEDPLTSARYGGMAPNWWGY